MITYYYTHTYIYIYIYKCIYNKYNIVYIYNNTYNNFHFRAIFIKVNVFFRKCCYIHINIRSVESCSSDVHAGIYKLKIMYATGVHT